MNLLDRTGRKLRSPLAQKVIIGIVLASSAITLCLTALQIYFYYRSELERVDATFRQIKDAHLNALSRSHWETNNRNLRLQLDGIVHIRNVEVVEVRDGSTVVDKVGRRTSANIVERQYPMNYVYRDRVIEIGTLHVAIGLDPIYDQLWREALGILANNAFKTFLVAIFAFLLFHRLVNRHLFAIANYMREREPVTSEAALILARAPHSRPDELDELAAAINIDRAKAQESYAALLHSEQNLRITLHSIGDAVIATDAAGLVTRMNPAAERLTGWSLADATGRPLLEVFKIVNAQTRERVPNPVERMMAHGEIVGLANHTALLSRDGREYPIADSAAPIRDAAGRIVGVVLVFSDVTEKYRAEAILVESETRYRALVDWSPEAIQVHRGGEIVYVNPASVALYGAQSARELVGTPFIDRVHPDDRPRVRERTEIILKHGRSTPSIELKHLKMDGTVIDVEVRGTATLYDGERAAHASLHDITARKRAEQDTARLVAIIGGSQDAIVSRDLDFKITSWNAAAEKLFGYTAAEVIGQSVMLLIPPEYQSEVARDEETLARSPNPVYFDSVRVTKDGRRIDVSLSLSWIRDERGAKLGVTLIIRDIRERKRADATRAALEAQLRESQKMEAIGTLAGGIAHDFNNIIATILGNAALARQDAAADPGAVIESLDEINKASERARDLVQQILAFSRRQPTERKVVSLAPIVEESRRLLRASISTRVVIEARVAAALPQVLANATQIEQVLINVATNAAQAMQGRPGRIDIELDQVTIAAALLGAHQELQVWHAQHPGPAVRIVLRDDGPGMDADVRERIFEPFFTTKPVGEGTGLGLAVVHGIMQTHEGAITVESEPGRGTTFALYLPVAQAAERDASPADAAPAPGQPGGWRILYLDDDEALVWLMTRLLARQGHTIRGYTSQKEALDALRAAPKDFDLVLTDYNMPGMSGVDVARAVRDIRVDLPVAVASGFVDKDLSASAADAGVREVIFKATNVQEYCAVVQRLAQTTGKMTKPS